MQYTQLILPVLGRQTLWLLLAFFLTLGMGENMAMAAAPANDNFDAAIAISGPAGSIAGTTVDATAQPPLEPYHSFTAPHHSIWYKWIAPSAAPIAIDTSRSSFDTVLAIYFDDIGDGLITLVRVVQNDDEIEGTILTSKVRFIPTAGKTYYIAIDGYIDGLGLDKSYGATALNWEISTYTLAITTDGRGFGSTTGDGTYIQGTTQEITATADPGSTFTGWSGDCTGITSPLSVLMDNDKICTATFIITPYTLTVNKTGAGTVTSSPIGIDCGADCSEVYDVATPVTLTATPDADNTFVGWSGGSCTGTQGCTVTMDADITVTAIFKKKFPWPMFLPAITKRVE
jgi:uncharacterized repeat protein (TIGR02543 family)